MNCKNTKCQNEVREGSIYCSPKCRNIFINSNCIDYNKSRETFRKKRDCRENEYYENPKRCLMCNSIIPFNKKRNSFCCSSCSVTYNNRGKNLTVETKNRIREKILLNNKEKKKCKNCSTSMHGRNKFCSANCLKEHRRKSMTSYQKYRSDCQFDFSLNSYPLEFDFTLVEKYGWYSPSNKKNNLDGVSRDHMLSIMDGFKLGISPGIISHPANCRLMIHRENTRKYYRSSITLDDLNERIRIFDEKYKT